MKGYVGNPFLESSSLPSAIGKGTVQVVKTHPEWKNNFQGITSIVSGEVDRDVAAYLADSEQRSCALGTAVATKGFLCTAAGGYLLERLPECKGEVMVQVEENLKGMAGEGGDTKGALKALLGKGTSPEELAAIIMEGIPYAPLEVRKPTTTCSCSEDRLFRSLTLIPRAEVLEIIENGENVEAKCEFCSKMYRLSPERVKQALDENVTKMAAAAEEEKKEEK